MPVGRIETGTLTSAMKICFGPQNLKTEVSSVEIDKEGVARAYPGDYVGFNVSNISRYELKRGYVASNSKEDPCRDTLMFVAQIIILSHPGKI